MRESIRTNLKSIRYYSYDLIDAKKKWYWLITVSLSCVLTGFSLCCGLPHVLLLQVMKYEDLLNWKNKCFRKYCSAKLNWRASEMIIIYGGTRWRRWHGSSHSAFFMQRDPTEWLVCLYIKEWTKRKSACSNMRKESWINNQSREQRGSGWAWGGYRTSIMEDSSMC